MSFRSLVPYVGERTARERIEELFDRKSTTGFLLGAMIGGLATTIVSAVAPGGLAIMSIATFVRVILWLIGVGLTIVVAVFWEKLTAAVDEATDET